MANLHLLKLLRLKISQALNSLSFGFKHQVPKYLQNHQSHNQLEFGLKIQGNFQNLPGQQIGQFLLQLQWLKPSPLTSFFLPDLPQNSCQMVKMYQVVLFKSLTSNSLIRNFKLDWRSSQYSETIVTYHHSFRVVNIKQKLNQTRSQVSF